MVFSIVLVAGVWFLDLIGFVSLLYYSVLWKFLGFDFGIFMSLWDVVLVVCVLVLVFEILNWGRGM